MRVLLVDDHALVRRALWLMLAQELDIEIVGEAANGREAVDLTRLLQPDVVLMDIIMPEMNGIDATRVIHTAFPHVCVIGLSMFGTATWPKRCGVRVRWITPPRALL